MVHFNNPPFILGSVCVYSRFKVNTSVGAFGALRGKGFVKNIKALGWKPQLGFGLSFGVMGAAAGALSSSKLCGFEMLKLPETNQARNSFVKT